MSAGRTLLGRRIGTAVRVVCNAVSICIFAAHITRDLCTARRITTDFVMLVGAGLCRLRCLIAAAAVMDVGTGLPRDFLLITALRRVLGMVLT